MSYRNSLRWLLAPLVAAAQLANALPEDRNPPIRMTSDSAVQEPNTVTYRGSVVIVQGTIRITADQVVVHHQEGKVQRVDAIGKPAHFQQQPEATGGLVKASADKLVYHHNEDRVELIQDAHVERDGNTVAGQRIEYLLTTETVRAQERVEMVLQPDNKQPAPQPEAAAPAQPAGEPPAQPAPNPGN